MRWRRKPAGIDTERNCVAVSLPAYKLLLLDTATPVCTHATPVYTPHLCVHTPHLCVHTPHLCTRHTCVYTRHTCVRATPVCTHATPVYMPHLCVHTPHLYGCRRCGVCWANTSARRSTCCHSRAPTLTATDRRGRAVRLPSLRRLIPAVPATRGGRAIVTS